MKKSIVIKIDIDRKYSKTDFSKSRIMHVIKNDILKLYQDKECIKPVFLQYRVT